MLQLALDDLGVDKTTQPKTRPLRTLDEIWEQARLDALNDPPLTQAQADRIAAILAPYWRQLAARTVA